MDSSKKESETKLNEVNEIKNILDKVNFLKSELNILMSNEIKKNVQKRIIEVTSKELEGIQSELNKLKDNKTENNKSEIIECKLNKLKNIECKLNKLKNIEIEFNKLKYIDNSEIDKYLPKDGSNISYSNIAHLYLHLSVEVYNILKSKKIYKWKSMGKSISKLEDAFGEIIEVLTIIGRKLPKKKGETKELIDKFKKDRKDSKDSIIQNKNLLFDSIGHYCNVMELVESKRFKKWTIIVAICSFVASVVSILFSYCISTRIP